MSRVRRLKELFKIRRAPLKKDIAGEKEMKKNFSKRILSLFVCIALVMTYLPITAMAAQSGTSTSIADPKTLSDWQTWFSEDSSRYAGGVFVDKSVYTATEAKNDEYFEDIKDSLNFSNDNFGNENFMVALSALGSNSEILGYSHIPTDTMLVLDASTSMGSGSASTSSIDDMVAGANEAIKRLLALNNYNRVGVVIYSGTASVLLPLDRYTSGNSNGDVLVYSRNNNQNRIYIASNVKDGNGANVNTSYIAQAQGTYTQGGIYAAAQEFLAADTTIEDGKIQAGTGRIPIMVLMSDGEPSYRTQTGAQNTINKYNAATNSNVDRTNFREDDITAFSTMLTAAWAEAEITAHYNNDTRFYTLGYALSANHQYAQNVLDPMNPNNSLARRFSGYATQYLAMNQNATSAIKNENNQDAFRITRLSSPEKVKTLDYVDRYWQASRATDLYSAFDAIVDEIVIQSRYYSTLVQSNNHAQDGFISFTDEIGTYMEVKNIKGIYIGDGKLVSGGMFAEFATTGRVTEFDSTNYSEEQLKGFENEILSAVAERFSISLSEASLLLNVAKDNGFISYTSPSNFSNFLAWYGDEDNNYLAPYTKGSAHAPDNAKYIVRSYFYMGDVTQNHVETSMLYSLVRIREDIETGRQIVDMNVPAALLPLVTYTITVDGDVLNDQNVTGITCEQKKPISLLFEVGIDSEITPINITEKVGEDFRRDANGIYTFYTNRWRNDNGQSFTMPSDVDPHVFNHGIMNTTVTQFIPSLENQRFYFTENTQILDASHNVYTGSKPTENNDYFVEYKWVEGDKNSATIKTAYDIVSSEILKNSESIIQIDGKQGWFIKKGTPQFFYGEDVHGERGHSHKTENKTNTLAFAGYPQVVYHDSEGHSGYHMLNYHGNNGLVKATPAQGIKLSKTVSQEVENAPDEFEFEIALNGSGLAAAYPVYIEYADGTSNTSTANVVGGKINVTLANGDIAYIYDLPTGTEYTVTELYNPYYSPVVTGESGTVALHTLSAVDFVNAPKGYGSLLVEKDVTHPFDTISNELTEQDFDITVEFKGNANDLALITPSNSTLVPDTAADSYSYSFKLKDGYDILFANIPEGVEYTVTENNIPNGYNLITDALDLAGTIIKDTQSEALLVNDYAPTAVSPKLTVSGEKHLNGRAWDSDIDKYQVVLQQVDFGGQQTVAIGSPVTVDVVKSSNADYSIDMSGIVYDKVGTYSYVVYEKQGNVDSISYDSSFAMFTVSVVDKGRGSLIVDSITVHQQTAILSGDSQNGWTLTKDFENNYQSTTISFSVNKRVVEEADNNVEVTDHRGGILFALYDSVTAAAPTYTALTDENGNAGFVIPVKQSEYAGGKYYYLREVIPLLNSQVVGMTYDTEFKYVVEIRWEDLNAAAPTYKFYNYDAAAVNGIGTEIDITTAPLVITNTYDDGVVSNPIISLGGKKTVNGGALRSGDEFTFELYETDATFSINGLSPKQTKTVTSQTVNGEYSFNGITFNSVGTKYLVVSERVGNAGGIGYDNTRYHITVDIAKATDNNNKTVLNATVSHIHKVGNGDVEANMLNFDNTYTVNGRESVVIGGKKILNGRTLVEGEFEFVIEAQTPNAPMPTVTRVKNEADGSFTFPAIRYSVVNQQAYNQTFIYTIRELVPSTADKKGITYNSNGKTEYTLAVTVEDNKNGSISKTVMIDGQPVSEINVTFENSYSAEDTSLTFGGTKAFNRDSGEFYFDLYKTDSNFAIAPEKLIETAKAVVTNGSGRYSITLDYTSADKGYHYYVLKEAVPTETKGIHYDVTEYHITVNVLDNGHGEMEAHALEVIKDHTFENVYITEMNFTNRYIAASAEYAIEGTKELKGKEIAADMFEFRLSNEDGEIATVKNSDNGSFVFPAQIFESVGEYVFYVEEVNGGSTIKGIAYDNARFTVTVPVLDDGEGNLYVDEANIKIEKGSAQQQSNVSAIAFVNEYKASATDAIYIEGTKQIKDNKRALEDKEFTFNLYNANESFEKGDLLKSASNAANGTFRFEKELSFEKAGKYYYIVTEQKGNAEYITYDETVYGVVITVEDNKEGRLSVAKTEIFKVSENGNTSAEKVEFVNIYDYTSPAQYPASPKTGENNTLWLWTALAFINTATLFGTFICKRKQKTK